MAVGSPPTVRRRQLGRELRRLRDESGLLAEDLAERLRCSASRISRIETARIRIAPGTVHEILDALDIDGPERGRLVKLAREADEPGWWQAYGDTLSYEYATYISLESEASSLKSFEPILVYGLLQTPEYARAVIEGSARPVPAAEADALVEVRMKRQEILSREVPPQLHAILDESVLHRVIGGPEVARAQLRHLIEMAQRPNVRIQVLPFASGTVAAHVTGPSVLIEFPDPQDAQVVYLESMAADVIERPDDIREYLAIYDRLCAEALGPDESIEKIESMLGGAR